MDRDAELRELMQREIKRYQGLLLYKERQQLKRGDFESIARTLIRRMKRGYWGIAILILWVALYSMPGGPFRWNWDTVLPRVVWTAVWICLITYMAHGWGRLSGSMTAVLSMLGKDETAPDQVEAT